VAPKRPAKPAVLKQPRPIMAFWNEIYQANWRNAVIAVAAVNTLRFIIHATQSFQDGRVDKLYHVPRLAHVSCAMGGLYIVTTVIQVFGVISAFSERLSLIRIYAHLSFLSALLIAVAGFVGGISYFVLSDDLVHECVSLAIVGSLQTKGLFRGKEFKWSNPSPNVAKTHCLAAWSNASVSQILGILLFSIVPAALFFFLAFVYYRQVTDPEHPASLLDRKSNVNNRRSHGNPSLNIDAAERRARHRSVPVIHLNGTPINPEFEEGSRGLSRGRKGKDSKSIKSKKRATIASLVRVNSTSSVSPYQISPGPPSYADATRQFSYGFGYAGQHAADRTFGSSSGAERSVSDLNDARRLV